ncbi:hypothetical protein FQN54_002926 [Arachnomyces sp. PD_36]|nr:hypothetical protein FQN54_002926 [Arachnomyces sp. PD_36]
MGTPLRIAVFECGKAAPGVKAKYGGYGGLFESHLMAAAKLSNNLAKEDLVVTKWDVKAREYPKLEDIDAVLMSGSNSDSFENEPWILQLVEFVKTLLAQRRVRIIGICFGHQILGRALGAQSGRNNGLWELGVVEVNLTETGKEVLGITGDKLALQQMHQDVVYTLPPGAINLGWTEKCAFQGFYWPERFLSLQGHPEFDEEIERECLVRKKDSGLFSAEVYEDAMSKIGDRHDGLTVSKAMLKFLRPEVES